jgi:cytosine/adenosine deaminase-related metal-dependent hydrolase
MRLLIRGRNAAVAVDGSLIASDGGPYDAVIDAPHAEVRPGLINCHDHLHRNHYGRLGRPPYVSAFDWADDIQRRHRRRIETGRRRPRRDALMEGAWKNLFAGVTTVVHHDPWEADFERDFPIRVARVGNADSVRSAEALARIDVTKPYCVHVAENAGATSDEVGDLESRGLLTANLLAVHAVGLDGTATERLRWSGAAVVWCPSSNLFMLGRTASSGLLHSGVDVLLGSESLLTGSGNLLDEIRFARARGELDDKALELAVGAKAAQRLGLPAPSLEPGAPADLILVEKPIVEASASDVSLVLVGGVPMVAGEEVARALGGFAGNGVRRTVGGVTRWTNFQQSGSEE